MRASLTWLAALLLVPLGLGQAHDHGDQAKAPLMVLLDVQGNNDVQVGDLARFEVIAFGADGLPEPHRDFHFQVLFAGKPLLETTAASGHDYDGILQFDVTFPSPGPYRARVFDAGIEVAHLEGWAVPAAILPAVVHLEGPTLAAVGTPALFRVWPEDQEGRQVQHFYTLLEVRRDGELTYRAKLHGHDEADLGPVEAEIGFPFPGTYTVSATVYQASPYGPQHLAFAPLHAEREVQVLPGASLASNPPTSAPLPTGIVQGGTGILRLLGTYDPSPEVGPGTLQHLSVIAMSPSSGGLVGHGNFAALLLGPGGERLFASRFLHEADGVLEFATTQPAAGAYLFQVHQDGEASIAMPFRVGLPAVGPTSGPHTVIVSGLERAQAGKPQPVQIAIHDVAGMPIQHAEVDVQVVGPDGVPHLLVKLHTHDDGQFPFVFTPLREGVHTIKVVPFVLESRPVAFLDQATWLTVPLEVGRGEAWPSDERPSLAQSPQSAAPSDDSTPLAAALSSAILSLGLVAAFFFYRRR
jgi:hypothetical protein